MHRRRIAGIGLGISFAILAMLAQAGSKALLVGIDGVQYQKLLAVSPVNFARLYHVPSYTGGVTGSSLQQATVSGPGWSTILTGVWASKHHVYSNDPVLANPDFPSLFKRIRDARPQAHIASITNWGSINQHYFRNDVTGNNVTLSGLSDQAAADKVIEIINTTAADFTFVHLDAPDHAGHGTCFGPVYDQALRDSDRRLGQILDAVAMRQAQGEDWLVMVTTDHGRDAAGCGHGAQTQHEKTAFIASNKPLNREFNEVVPNLENRDFDGIYGRPAQTSIAPTILRHLGIPLLAEWLLDGVPMLGETGVRKLMPARHPDVDLRWYAADEGTVTMLRNGLFAGVAPAGQMSWKDPIPVQGEVDYSAILNGNVTSIRLSRREVQATLDWDVGRSYYFLKGGVYVRYNQILDRAESGYPKAVNDSTWPGLAAYADSIVAGFSKDTIIAYLFLNDGRYIRYNKTLDRVETGYPKSINDQTWPGIGAYATQIRAALRWRGNRVYFFLNDGRYIRYDLAKDAADDGYPAFVNDSNWPGLGRYARDITAAVKWDDSRGYFFLTGRRYIRYNIPSDKVEAGYPRMVDNQTWPGLGLQ
ncbi:alkaline phosphatase family protein [Chitinivorax sp. B]|uniref:alkaline phosphatase family protein n=1 Tax=Chitinivorax sp. B TaxID=2502235 RepID=UPI002017D548|nr:alkaline phosphatase family protein [Chitinivorax sp. B]